MTSFSHIPILLGEAMALLRPERGGVFVDGTLGGGGHARRCWSGCRVRQTLWDRSRRGRRRGAKRLSRWTAFAIRGNF